MIRSIVILYLVAASFAQVAPRTSTNGTYQNKTVGISYSMPSGYQIVSTNAESLQQRTVGQRILMIADKLTGRPFKNRIALASDESKNYREPPLSFKDYAGKLLSMNGKRAGVKITQEMTPTSVNGKTFYHGYHLEEFPEVTLHKVLVSAEANGYWLGWTFVSTDPNELEELVESALKTRFDDPKVKPRKAASVSRRSMLRQQLFHRA